MSAPLPPRRNRLFVVGLLAVMVGLALFAAVVIRRGWSDDALQERVRQFEAEREASAP